MKIFLTGGSGGIGNVIFNLLIENGIEVIAPPSNILNLKGDFNITSSDVYDGFIHCAGINEIKSIYDINKSELDNMFNINTFSFIELVKQLHIKSNGNVISIGSIYATETKENRIQYTMSKHALYGAVKTMALEMSEYGIKVNMISPGFVDTELTRKNNSLERIEFLKNNTPLGLTNSEDIAQMCLFLLKYNNSITGQNIIIDGGYSLKGI